MNPKLHNTQTSKTKKPSSFQSKERQRGQVVRWLWSNHFSRQPLWKKCLQDNSLTSCSASNPQRQTQHCVFPPFLQKDLNCVMEILLSLEISSGHPSEFSSKVWELILARITWSTDLAMFFSRATEKTVFITSNGSTPSAALGKFESPIWESASAVFLREREREHRSQKPKAKN